MSHRTTRRVAFSLIELMVVVAMLALLISLLLPVLRQARGHARSMQCRSIMRGDGMLKSMVGQDTRYIIHAAEYPKYAQDFRGRYFILNLYEPGDWLFHAPLDKWAGKKPHVHRRVRADAVCPEFDRGDVLPTATSYNNCYVWNRALRPVSYGGPVDNSDLRPERYETILPYAILMAEGEVHRSISDTNYYFYGHNTNGNGYKFLPYRHLGTSNFLSHDGAVKGYTPDAVPEKNILESGIKRRNAP